MTTSIARSVGSFTGKSAAYVWEGTRLASTQFATGAAEGYALKAEELREKRLALKPVGAPPVVPARKVKVATA